MNVAATIYSIYGITNPEVLADGLEGSPAFSKKIRLHIDFGITRQYHFRMNSKQIKTLRAIFSSPTPANIEWMRIESLFLALGAIIIEGSGSRASFIINDEKGDFHRPHPGKEAKRYQVRNAQDFLTKAGVQPS